MEPSFCVRAYLRQGIAVYGLEDMYTSLNNICKGEYEFLKSLYDSSAVPPVPVALPQETQEEIPRPEVVQKLRSDTKVRIVKKPSEPTQVEVPQVEVPQVPQVQVPQVQVPQIQAQHSESGFTDPKDIKRWQKEQEEKKKRELDSQGINPASLLTKENLERWIVNEKKTFAFVAREYVGLPDSMVSSAAKSYGIQSETSKRRAMIAANKKKF